MATRIKRYEAPLVELDRLLARIEEEMGPDAELETREFRRRRFLGLFGGERMIEVVAILQVDGQKPVTPAAVRIPKPTEPATTAPLDPEPEPQAQLAAAQHVDISADAEISVPPHPSAEARIYADAQGMADAEQPLRVAPPVPAEPPMAEPEPTREPVQSIPQQAPLPPIKESIAASGQNGDSTAEEIHELRATISELRDTIQLLTIKQLATESDADRDTAPAKPDVMTLPGYKPLDVVDTVSHLPSSGRTMSPGSVVDPVALDPSLTLPDVQKQVYDRLLDWNIGAFDALDLINTALAGFDEQAEVDRDSLLKAIGNNICRNVLLSGGIKLGSTPPGKAVALVGATGVGKTTTIAKLAAQFAFQHGKRVCLVSLDNYRIAAAEQLRTYAEIMGIEIDIVFGHEEFDQVLTERRQNDLVLIDTAGRAPTNTKQIYQLREIFNAHPPDEVHLVISASTKGDDLRMLLQDFEPLSYDHVIVTKLDETRSLGTLFNLVKHCPLPISYFTIGQSVPEDIRTANLKFVQTWIEQGRIS
ncbi:hypothetical protein JW859_12365 [bacterium]|nr:hypothetical protein [bacterium]